MHKVLGSITSTAGQNKKGEGKKKKRKSERKKGRKEDPLISTVSQKGLTRSVPSNTVVNSHMWLFKSALIKIK
jgi:hypothetical protein